MTHDSKDRGGRTTQETKSRRQSRGDKVEDVDRRDPDMVRSTRPCRNTLRYLSDQHSGLRRLSLRDDFLKSAFLGASF